MPSSVLITASTIVNERGKIPVFMNLHSDRVTDNKLLNQIQNSTNMSSSDKFYGEKLIWL